MAKDTVVPFPLTQADTGLQQGTFWGDTKLLTHNIQKDPKKKNQINTMLFKLYEVLKVSFPSFKGKPFFFFFKLMEKIKESNIVTPSNEEEHYPDSA